MAVQARQLAVHSEGDLDLACEALRLHARSGATLTTDGDMILRAEMIHLN